MSDKKTVCVRIAVARNYDGDVIAAGHVDDDVAARMTPAGALYEWDFEPDTSKGNGWWAYVDVPALPPIPALEGEVRDA